MVVEPITTLDDHTEIGACRRPSSAKCVTLLRPFCGIPRLGLALSLSSVRTEKRALMLFMNTCEPLRSTTSAAPLPLLRVETSSCVLLSSSSASDLREPRQHPPPEKFFIVQVLLLWNEALLRSPTLVESPSGPDSEDRVRWPRLLYPAMFRTEPSLPSGCGSGRTGLPSGLSSSSVRSSFEWSASKPPSRLADILSVFTNVEPCRRSVFSYRL